MNIKKYVRTYLVFIQIFCNEKVRIKKVKDKGDVYVGCDEKNT